MFIASNLLEIQFEDWHVRFGPIADIASAIFRLEETTNEGLRGFPDRSFKVLALRALESV